MNEAGLVEHGERVEELLGEDANERRAEAAERVLLDKLVEIGRQELEDEAQVRKVDERVLEPEYVVLVRRVPRVVELDVSRVGTTARTSSRIVTSIIDC